MDLLAILGVLAILLGILGLVGVIGTSLAAEIVLIVAGLALLAYGSRKHLLR